MTQSAFATPAANRQPITDERSTDRLTLADLARLLAPSPMRDEAHSMNRSLLQRYDANKDLQALLGKQGSTYPADSLPIWEAIAEARAQEPPLVRPETAAVFVAGLLDRQPVTSSVSSAFGLIGNRFSIGAQKEAEEPAALVVAREIGGDVAASMRRLVTMAENMALTDDRLAVIERLADALDRHSDVMERMPAPDDALLEADDVKQFIPRGEAWLRKNVPSVKVGRARMWKRSAILEYIATL